MSFQRQNTTLTYQHRNSVTFLLFGIENHHLGSPQTVMVVVHRLISHMLFLVIKVVLWCSATMRSEIHLEICQPWYEDRCLVNL